MRTPGITVRPIITLDGEHEVNEVWFENVKVPVQNLVGEEGRGWTYAKFLLSHERTGIAGVGALQARAAHAQVHRVAGAEERPAADARIRASATSVARVEIDLMALEITNLRVAAADRDGRAPGPEASILKIKGTEIQQALTELMMEAVGPYALPYLPDGVGRSLAGRARRPRVCGAAGRALLQLPQGQHLRRLERDPAQHHRAADSGLVRSFTATHPIEV